MLNKIFWFFILLFAVYLLLVFKTPSLALLIENSIGISGMSKIVTDYKLKYDDSITKIPTEREVKDTYNVIYSGAVDYKDKFINGAAVTKGKIDIIREKISGAEDTYNDVKDGYDDIKEGYEDAKKIIDEGSKKLEVIKSAIDKVSNNTNLISSGVTSIINTSTGTTNSGVINK